MNRIKTLEMTKWLMDVPISSQLPSSLTKKKKFKVITSVVARTIINKENGGRFSDLVRTPKIPVINMNGISNLIISKTAIKKGINIVVNL